MSNFWEADPVATPAGKGAKNFWEADPVAAHSSAPITAKGLYNAADAGVAAGVAGLGGAVGDLTELGAKGLEHASNFISDKLGLPKYERPAGPSILDKIPRSKDIAASIQRDFYNGEKPYAPQNTVEEYAKTAGEFAPAVLGGGEGLLSKLLTRVAVPSVASETAGQATKGTEAEPYARVVGALMSPAVIAAARRGVTPLPATAERTTLANTLRGEGVDLTAGQATGSRPLQWAESTFGDMPGSGGRAARTMTNQGEQFTGAALRRVGENAERATPDVIDNAFRRIGGQFDAVAARNHVTADAPLGRALVNVEDEYNNLVGPTQRAPVVANTVQDIRDIVAGNGGHITGEQYNALTSRLARQARGAQADPQLQEALRGTREALDDAMERSLHASGNTADREILREARNQYRNLMVVEKAATGAGSNAAEGLISPSQLRNAVVQQNRRSYARGQGDFADLARSGEALLKPLPQSGTAPRQNLQHVLTMLGGAAGGAAGGFPGAAAGIVAPAAAGRVLMSRPAQTYLQNQAWLPGAGDTVPQSLARALMASQGSREAAARNDTGR